jgi:hypothetical protein
MSAASPPRRAAASGLRARGRLRASLLLLATCAHGARAPAFPLSPDAPVAADAVQAITGAGGAAWTVSSETWRVDVPATVPGDLVTDLQRAGVIGDPWRELGWLNTTTPGALGAPLWDVGEWGASALGAPSARGDSRNGALAQMARVECFRAARARGLAQCCRPADTPSLHPFPVALSLHGVNHAERAACRCACGGRGLDPRL